ncbi:MAG TPA: DUF5908 family protein [Burkholderiaceae bacterium]|nr:DUF5908 family protein [Burkholderiaceae bacterium]
MPIVIDEVLITVEVENQAGPAAPGGGAEPAAGTDKQALVAECVERVLAILDQRKEP